MAEDLGLAGLDAVADATGTIGATFDYALEFGTGPSGFFFDTSASNEVSMTVTLDQVTFDPAVSIGGQDYVAVDAGSVFNGTIGIDLQSTGGTVTAAQMTTVTVAGTLDGTADVNVGLSVSPAGDMTPPISTNLTVGWGFDGAAVTPDDTNASFGDRPDVSFDTVKMDLGAFMGDFVTPLVEQINGLLDPIRPVPEILTASIKVLEDFPGLGDLLDATGDGRVTLLDILALKFPDTDSSALEDFADIALEVADWADFLSGEAFTTGELNMGNFDIGSGDIRAAGFNLADAVASFQGLAGDLNSVVASLTGSGWSHVDAGSGMSGREILQSMLGDGVFDLPILNDPAQWMNLFLGNVTDLVTVDLPDVSFDTGTKTILSFPIFPLVSFDVSAGFAASFNFDFDFDFDFGFDTRGLITDGLNALDGLYLIDGPDAEIMLAATMALGLTLHGGIVSITGQGDMTGTILLDLKDSLQQSEAGKLYFDEFIDAVTVNPFSIFDASGSITVGFSAIVDSILGELWHWDSPRVTLGDFGFDTVSETFNPKLANLANHTLTLNMGDRATHRSPFVPPGDIGELMSLSAGTGPDEGKFVLEFYGTRQTFTGITAIVGDGQHMLDGFVISEDLQISVNFSGGTEGDIIQGAALGDTLDGEADNDALFGRAGNDVLYGAKDDDFLDGGTGGDTIDGGDGADRVSYIASDAAIIIDFAAAVQSGGNAAGDVLSGIELLDGSAFADSVFGSQGDGLIMGMQGDDTLRSGSFDQGLFGNGGNDELEGGGHDTLTGGEGDDIYIVRNSHVWINENEIDEIVDGSESGYDWVQAYASVDLSVSDAFIEKITLKGKAQDAVANGQDNLIQGNDVDNVLSGLDGADSITGNNGADTIYGGSGSGKLYGGKGADGAYGGSNADSVYGGTGSDVLYGDAGNDLIFGATGNDTLGGDAGADVLYSDDGADFITGGLENDKIYAGIGFDILEGGSGNDTMFGVEGNDYLVGNTGADKMYGGVDGDYYEADGSDTVFEDVNGGIDFVFATEDLALKAEEEVEIVSLEGLYGKLWLAPWLEPLGAPRGEGYYFLAATQGVASPTRDADLTGNELNQVLIADLSDVEHNVVNHLEGMAGADTLVGDNQLDCAVYLQSDAAVKIDLSVAEQSGGHAQGDYFYAIHHLIGSAFNDTLTAEDFAIVGFDFDNNIDGAGGDDLILGRGGAILCRAAMVRTRFWVAVLLTRWMVARDWTAWTAAMAMTTTPSRWGTG